MLKSKQPGVFQIMGAMNLWVNPPPHALVWLTALVDAATIIWVRASA
jgi:hypothetical protein